MERRKLFFCMHGHDDGKKQKNTREGTRRTAADSAPAAGEDSMARTTMVPTTAERARAWVPDRIQVLPRAIAVMG